MTSIVSRMIFNWQHIKLGNKLKKKKNFKNITISSNACVHANIRLMTLKLELIISISSIFFFFFNGTDLSVGMFTGLFAL